MAVVRGRSMLPGLRDGDRLLMLHGGTPVPGRLAVVLLPDGVLAVKRAVRREPAGWWVARDNPAEGVDSRHVGAIPPDRIVGRVLCRIWPLWRRTGPRVSSGDRGSAGDPGL
jgi:phage repressor protein C with HTH and peptisase S24 domain